MKNEKQELSEETLDTLKLPPHSLEAEQAVLGGLLISPDALDRVADKLDADDFYAETHRTIFKTIVKLASEGHTADVVTVSEALNEIQKLDFCGGVAYVGSLAANIVHYAALVRERSILRQLVKAGEKVVDLGLNPLGRKASEVLDEAENIILRIAEKGSRGQNQFVPVGSVLGEVTERVEKLFSRDTPSDVTGVPTGFCEIDKMTAGMQPGNLIVIASRPSMGKSALALNIAKNVALFEHKPVAVFDLEETATETTQRLLSSVGCIPSQRLRTGRLEGDDWDNLTSALGTLNDAPIIIDETPALSAIEIRSRARRIKRIFKEKGLGLVIVDSVQLVHAARGENRAAELSEIAGSLKALAKELDVPVIAVSELNRSLESRPNKRPVMSDLLESGALEDIADVILFIYRDEVYNPESKDKGSAEIIIGKQRNGPIGTVRLAFRGEFTRFENFAAPGTWKEEEKWKEKIK
jgi:replicative DNA helicase